MTCTFRRPDYLLLQQAGDRALEHYPKYVTPWGARVMCAIAAAGLRDRLTDNSTDLDAPFDAVALEVVVDQTGAMFAGDIYWTQAGEEVPLEWDVQHGLNEWLPYADTTNSSGWLPLCEAISGTDQRTIYRLDLTQAVTVPIPEPDHTNTPPTNPATPRIAEQFPPH